MTPPPAPRIYIVAARRAPVAAVLRRGPSRTWHVMRWATDTDEVEAGSWFNGRIYPERCELSWDGKWLLYFAMGVTGETWTGVCRLPRLKTLAHVPGTGTYGGGGFWFGPDQVHLNDVGLGQPPVIEASPLPFTIGKPPFWRRWVPDDPNEFVKTREGIVTRPTPDHPNFCGGKAGTETLRGIGSWSTPSC